jgi:hypothetical protein
MTPANTNLQPNAITVNDAPPTQFANSIVLQTTIADRVAFYHATVFWPSLSTWCKPIGDNLLSTWPALTCAQWLRKYPPSSAALVKGHLDQTCANQNSTKPQSHPPAHTASHLHSALPNTVVSNTTTPAYQEPTKNKLGHRQDLHQSHWTLHPCISGHSNMLVVYDYESNFIHVEPLSSKAGLKILTAY